MEVHEDLSCIYCLELAINPIGCTKCGALICENESDKFIQQKCPTCATGQMIPNPFAHSVISSQKFLCEKGCSRQIKGLLFREHVNRCDGVVVEVRGCGQCSDDDCRIEDPKVFDCKECSRTSHYDERKIMTATCIHCDT